MVQNSSSEQRCSEGFDVCNKEHPEIGDLVGSGQVSEQSRLLDKNLVGLGLTWCQEFSGGSAMATVNGPLGQKRSEKRERQACRICSPL